MKQLIVTNLVFAIIGATMAWGMLPSGSFPQDQQHAPPRAPVVIPDAPNVPRLFRDAHVVPNDVSVFVHIEDAASLRTQFADRPIQRWIERVLGRSEASEAWQRLAARLDLSETALFDAVLGERFTFVAMQSPLESESLGAWALLTTIDPAARRGLMHRLRPAARLPRHNMPLAALPDQGLVLASDGDLLIIGPAEDDVLFNEMLARLAAPKADALAFDHRLEAAKTLGDGQAAIYMRHEPPMGGFSLAVASLNGDELRIAHEGRFEAAPFDHGITKIHIDMAPLAVFERGTLFAIIEPTDTGEGLTSNFLTAVIGMPLLAPELRRNLGSRRITAFGERDPRVDQPAAEVNDHRDEVDVLSTTVAVAYEVDDPQSAVDQLDAHLARLNERLYELAEVNQIPPTLPDQLNDPGRMRHLDLGDAGSTLSGGFPVLREPSLNWAVADGVYGTYAIIASCPELCQTSAEALGTPRPVKNPLPAGRGRFEHTGTLDGFRLARHLESWADQADELAMHGEAESVRKTFTTLSSLAFGMERVRWQIERDAVNHMRLNVQIQLAGPATDRGH